MDGRVTPCDSEVFEGLPRTMEACGERVYGTPDQFRETPREEPNLELLALEEANSFIAPECAYERVERDVNFLREEFWESRWNTYSNAPTIEYAPLQNGDSLQLSIDDETAEAIRTGTYEAWDCLNNHYEKKDHEVVEINEIWRVRLQFEGTYDMRRVAENYAELPGLIEHLGKRVHEVRGRGSSRALQHRTNLCIDIDEDRYRYVLLEGWGDCHRGCTYHHARYFTTTADGEVCFEDAYRIESQDAQESAPDWLDICGFRGVE